MCSVRPDSNGILVGCKAAGPGMEAKGREGEVGLGVDVPGHPPLKEIRTTGRGSVNMLIAQLIL